MHTYSIEPSHRFTVDAWMLDKEGGINTILLSAVDNRVVKVPSKFTTPSEDAVYHSFREWLSKVDARSTGFFVVVESRDGTCCVVDLDFDFRYGEPFFAHQ